MSWANMCETSDKESEEFEDKTIKKESQRTLQSMIKAKHESRKLKVIKDEKSKDDGLKYTESKTGEFDATEIVKNTECSTKRNEDFEYRMD